MLDLSHICSRLELDPLARGLQIADARELAREFFPRLDTDRPALVANLATASLARQVRRTLAVNYPTEHRVTIVRRDQLNVLALSALPHAKGFGREAVLYLPPLPQSSSAQSLAAIVAHLRAPAGCPWDREQTHTSLRRALLEETYEVLEALDESDPAKLQEELGDLLLHVLFQTQIAREANEFTLAEVGAQLAAKLIRRHPHVFGDVQVKSAADVLENWEQIKQQEKQKGGASHVARLDADIPRELPALARAQKIFSRARRSAGARISPNGTDETEPILRKIKQGRDRERNLGDVLFLLASVAEESGLDAESALRGATARFVARAGKT